MLFLGWISFLFVLKMIKLLQWNCRGLWGKLREFSNVILNYDVSCIQETWLNDTQKVYFKNYQCFRNDRNPPCLGGGTLIVCDNLDPIFYPSYSASFKGCEFTMIFIRSPNPVLDRIL